MLSQRQKDELNRAIADYLHTNNYKDSFDNFCRETNLPADICNDKKKHRLSRKEMDHCSSLTEENNRIRITIRK